MNSALYSGRVQHLRLRPRRHHLKYGFFWALFDLDEIVRLAEGNRWFSCEGFNLFSFYQGDHLAPGGRLREQIGMLLQRGGIEPGGRIRLMCLPRMLGFVFNPISVFFCDDLDGKLAAVVYEVNNTFGQRHCYFFKIEDSGRLEHSCAKDFYVSPFMPMQVRYEFSGSVPGAHHALKIIGRDEAGIEIIANFTGKREEFNDRALLRAFATHPMLTLRVVLGIHWQALLILLKGLRIQPRPAPPPQPVTFVGLEPS